MKKLKIILLILISTYFMINIAIAWVVDMWAIWNKKVITDVSINSLSWSNAIEKLNNWWLSFLQTAKVILSWVVLIYLVYLGFMMVMAMWAEDKLTATKRQIYYSLLAFLFINIPWQLYWVFSGKTNSDVTTKNWESFSSVQKSWDWNMFINFDNWNSTIENGVISFIKVILIWIVIMLFMMAAIWIISSWWNDEKKKKAQKRFINWILWLIFMWVIQMWTYVAYSGDIPKWQSLFAQLSNLALFFAWPVAIFFLIIGWFYYITSAWDEAKAKKWATIIKNTFVAVIILLASYAFLKDLADFNL